MKNFNSLAVFVVMSISSCMQAGYLQSALCALFGSTPISEPLHTYLGDANAMLGSNTRGYVMNDRAKLLGLASFTWAGATWLDENDFQNVSENLQRFQCTHEPCHDVLWHGIKRSAVVGACFALPMVVLSSSIGKCLLSAALLATVVPYVSQKFECDADVLAARILCNHGKKDVVEQYCKVLEESSAECDNSIMSWLLPSVYSRLRHIREALAPVEQERW